MERPIPDDFNMVEMRRHMRRALSLARRGLGTTTPNPMVGAVLVTGDRQVVCGWHRMAGEAHAEVDAIRKAQNLGMSTVGATLYVTLEPCSTQGRTPPCTRAIVDAGIRRVVVAAIDPNPAHQGRGIGLLRESGVEVVSGVLASESERLNEVFNHWIVHRSPWITVKAAMTLDGRIADADQKSKWITNSKSRSHGLRLRLAHDAIVVGVQTVLADNPQLTRRGRGGSILKGRTIRRFIMDSQARTPLSASVLSGEPEDRATIVVGMGAPADRVQGLSSVANVWRLPSDATGRVAVTEFVRRLGEHGVCSLLVEGGGELVASFLSAGTAHRVAFFYAPKVLASTPAVPALGGDTCLPEAPRQLRSVRWRRFGDDLFMTALV